MVTWTLVFQSYEICDTKMCDADLDCCKSLNLILGNCLLVWLLGLSLTPFSLLLFPPISPPQVLARRLSPDSWDGEPSVSVIPGADLRAVPGQVCGVRQDERCHRGSAALLLHDRRQGGQDPGAAGELWGSGQEQRYWGGAVRSCILANAVLQ